MKNWVFTIIILCACAGIAGSDYFLPIPGISPVADEFSQYSDSRIYYKPGMEKEAGKIGEILQNSIEKVEIQHKKGVVSPVVIHICDTPSGFTKYTGGNTRINAAVSVNGLLLSPLAFEKIAMKNF